MSISFSILRNQLNNAYDMIRPETSRIISIAISIIERENEENSVLPLSSLISRLETNNQSDVEIISDFIDDNRVANSASIPIFQNFLNRIRNNM
jgi:hypothetical protein